MSCLFDCCVDGYIKTNILIQQDEFPEERCFNVAWCLNVICLTGIVCCCRLACECVADVTGMTDTQRQIFMNAYLSPESIRASTVRFDSLQQNYTDLKQGTSKRKFASGENVCRASHMIVSVSGIQLPVLNPKSQVCIGLKTNLLWYTLSLPRTVGLSQRMPVILGLCKALVFFFRR
jgi:hypothetical protein